MCFPAVHGEELVGRSDQAEDAGHVSAETEARHGEPRDSDAMRQIAHGGGLHRSSPRCPNRRERVTDRPQTTPVGPTAPAKPGTTLKPGLILTSAKSLPILCPIPPQDRLAGLRLQALSGSRLTESNLSRRGARRGEDVRHAQRRTAA